MSRRCGYRDTTTGHPCKHLVGPAGRCAAGHTVARVPQATGPAPGPVADVPEVATEVAAMAVEDDLAVVVPPERRLPTRDAAGKAVNPGDVVEWRRGNGTIWWHETSIYCGLSPDGKPLVLSYESQPHAKALDVPFYLEGRGGAGYHVRPTEDDYDLTVYPGNRVYVEYPPSSWDDDGIYDGFYMGVDDDGRRWVTPGHVTYLGIRDPEPLESSMRMLEADTADDHWKNRAFDRYAR